MCFNYFWWLIDTDLNILKTGKLFVSLHTHVFLNQIYRMNKRYNPYQSLRYVTSRNTTWKHLGFFPQMVRLESWANGTLNSPEWKKRGWGTFYRKMTSPQDFPRSSAKIPAGSFSITGSSACWQQRHTSKNANWPFVLLSVLISPPWSVGMVPGSSGSCGALIIGDEIRSMQPLLVCYRLMNEDKQQQMSTLTEITTILLFKLRLHYFGDGSYAFM